MGRTPRLSHTPITMAPSPASDQMPAKQAARNRPPRPKPVGLTTELLLCGVTDRASAAAKRRCGHYLTFKRHLHALVRWALRDLERIQPKNCQESGRTEEHQARLQQINVIDYNTIDDVRVLFR